jgi:hypothetical protein
VKCCLADIDSQRFHALNWDRERQLLRGLTLANGPDLAQPVLNGWGFSLREWGAHSSHSIARDRANPNKPIHANVAVTPSARPARFSFSLVVIK